MTASKVVALHSLLFLCTLASCSRTYTGIFWIPAENHESSWNSSTVSAEVFDAIRDLGFHTMEPGYFLKRSTDLPGNGIRYQGDESSVTVAVSGNPLAITVSDTSTNIETAFTRELKTRIRDRLERALGIKDIPFQRQVGFPPFG